MKGIINDANHFRSKATANRRNILLLPKWFIPMNNGYMWRKMT